MRETDGSAVGFGGWSSFRVAGLDLERVAGVVDPAVRLHRAVVELVGVEPAALSDAELVDLASALESSQRLLDAARMKLHAALEARGATIDEFGHTTKQWLGAEHGMAGSEAGRRVRVANKVCRHLPLVAEAMARGEITFEHCRVLADLLTRGSGTSLSASKRSCWRWLRVPPSRSGSRTCAI